VRVGHSSAVRVITGAGTHERVAVLSYIAAFVPDSWSGIRDAIALVGAPTDCLRADVDCP
jgi:hypothetical protein